MSTGVDVESGSAIVDYRHADGQTLAQSADRVSLAALTAAIPWRTFRWHEGQRHFPGQYWSVTEDDHVNYESRLELSALLMADFDLEVHRIKAQPFLLTAVVDGRQRRHVPDYLLRTDTGPVVVDVVRAERLAEPKIQLLCAWTRRLVESLSWDYRVVSDQPPALLGNIRFLAGFRRMRFINGGALAYLQSCANDLAGLRIDDAERRAAAGGFPLPILRSALMHLLWCQEFVADLTKPLGPSTVLEVAR
jgi:hypothetical protein